jgi:DNA modification methylase
MRLKVEYIPIDTLKPYDKNAKIHTKEQIEQIKQSIQEFGMNDPIGIWGKDNLIVEGHGRLMACKELGYKEVPVIRLDGLTDEQRRAYTLVHNQTTMNTGFDIDILNEELENIDLDMSDYGFDIEIDDIEEGTEVKEDEAPEVKDGEPKAKRGDIYQLGRHRLMCGDSTKAEDIDRLMDGAKAKLLLTDPPYGVKIVKGAKVVGDKPFGSTRGEAKNAILKAREYAPIIGDDTTDTARINYEITKNYTDNQIIFGGNYFTDFLPPSRCWIIWDKEVPKESFFAQVEMAWCSKDGNAKIYKYLWSGLCREGDRKTELNARVHPTQKPVGMLADILKDFSEENDSILDCFGGSGSTLIACEQLNRKCYMMELDPHYVDVIIERWENFTGQKATLLNEV